MKKSLKFKRKHLRLYSIQVKLQHFHRAPRQAASANLKFPSYDILLQSKPAKYIFYCVKKVLRIAFSLEDLGLDTSL